MVFDQPKWRVWAVTDCDFWSWCNANGPGCYPWNSKNKRLLHYLSKYRSMKGQASSYSSCRVKEGAERKSNWLKRNPLSKIASI